MNKIIILPTYLKKREWPYIQLFHKIKNQLGFELRFADKIDVPADTDDLFLWGMPYHNRPDLIPGFFTINKNTRLILHTGDINCHNNKICLKNKIKVFERCDIILSPSYEYFSLTYPQFMDKYAYLPASFSSYERYAKLPFNISLTMKCLLSGTVSWAYPLRSFIKKNKTKDIKYVGKGAGYVKDRYARLINSYFCCVTSSGVSKVVLTKFFEIPAAGSLLLTNTIDDFDRLGFVPGHHYVSITKKSVFTQISDCLKNPDKYEHIRKRGMEFVRKNHSVDNRIKKLKKILG